jgi:tetratricopeptide (TPR) repeat protein
MILAKINGKEDSVLRKQYHVLAFPTLVMLDKDGKEIDRVVGYSEPDEFLKTIKDYSQGIGTLADLLKQAESNPDRVLAFEIAEKYKYRGGSDEAAVWYQKVIDGGDPRDSLSGESRIALADMHRRAKQYDLALEEFQGIMKDFEGTGFAEDAEIWLAIVYKQKGDTAQAIKTYEGFLTHYPESEYAEFATKQISKLKGETAKK